MSRKYELKGFLLLEIMISLAILSSVAAIIAYYQWNVIRKQQEALIYNEALAQASSFLESIALNQRLSRVAEKKDGTFTLTWKRCMAPQIDEIPPGLTTNYLAQFALVEVIVVWKSLSGEPISVTLTSGFTLKNE